MHTKKLLVKQETTHIENELQTLVNANNAATAQVVYFIGVGGIGMSALARFFNARGYQVYGYDKTKTALTAALESEGIHIHYTENVLMLPKQVALVVYTPAIAATHRELVFFREHGYLVVKRSDVLQAISASTFNICVAGTHGKTTVSAMIAHVLRHSGVGCNAFLGGIATNYNTNFWSSANKICVIEADEYDRSFLKLAPNVAIITAMDADHLDIYGTEVAMQDAFVAFGNKIKTDGLLINKFGLIRAREISVSQRLSYSLQNDAADVFASGIQIINGGYQFNVQLPDAFISNVHLKIGGMHNVENAVAAIAVAHAMKIDDENIKAAIAAFTGVKRRFEYVLPPTKQEPGAYIQPVLIDDYAHHPEELKALLTSVRSLFAQRAITVVFQPHLFSRTRDLAAGFAHALSIADTVILLPVYPAREQPIEGVTSQLILDHVSASDKMLLTKEGLLIWMQEHKLDKTFGEVVVMAGAGNIDEMVQPVKRILENK